MSNGEDKGLCDQHFMMHDQAIRNNSESIVEINRSLAGLPEKLENIIKQMEKLCNTMEKTDDKFLSKEVFNIEKMDVKSDIKTLYSIVGAIGLLLIGAFIAHLMGKL